MELYLVCQLLAGILQRLRLACRDIRVPFHPRSAPVRLLQSHEQGKIFQPPSLFGAESVQTSMLRLIGVCLPSLVGAVQYRHLRGDHRSIIHTVGGEDGIVGKIVLCQQALIEQPLQAD